MSALIIPELAGEPVTHLKSDIRATTWCGLKYNLATVRRLTDDDEKPPICTECQAIEDGEKVPSIPRPLFYGDPQHGGRRDTRLHPVLQATDDPPA